MVVSKNISVTIFLSHAYTQFTKLWHFTLILCGLEFHIPSRTSLALFENISGEIFSILMNRFLAKPREKILFILHAYSHQYCVKWKRDTYCANYVISTAVKVKNILSNIFGIFFIKIRNFSCFSNSNLSEMLNRKKLRSWDFAIFAIITFNMQKRSIFPLWNIIKIYFQFVIITNFLEEVEFSLELISFKYFDDEGEDLNWFQP